MRDINVPVTELSNSVAWERAIAAAWWAGELQYPLGETAWEHVTTTCEPVYCCEGIQATLCPLGLVCLDPEDYPTGSLAFVADGYVYVLHSAEELHAVQHQEME